MAVYRTRVSALTAKIETVSGTDSVPTLGANAVQLAAPPLLKVDFLEAGNRDDVIFGGMGVVPRSQPGGRFATLTVKMETRGNGVGYSTLRPEPDVFLRMAGFTYGGAGVYNSLDDGFETGTLYCYVGNKLFKLVGCVCSMKFSGTANQRAFWEFAVTGVCTSITQVTLTSPTINTTIPPNFRNSAVAIGSFNFAGGLLSRSFEVNYAATIAPRPAAGATDGLVGYAVTNIVPSMNQQIEQIPLATFDPFAISRLDGGATATGGSVSVGSTANNIVTYTWGNWALETPGVTDDSGLLMYDLTGRLTAGALVANGREGQIVFS